MSACRASKEGAPPQAAAKEIQQSFDLDDFLGQSLVARVATVGRTGPTVRPLWYLWEGHAFWWLTGGWSKLGQLLERDPRVALVVDTRDLARGEVLQATARGSAQIQPFDADRARRWRRRYLGAIGVVSRTVSSRIPPRDSSCWSRRRFGRATCPIDRRLGRGR